MSEIAHQRSLEAYLPYMRDVAQCQRLLQELALTWRMIEGSTRMSGGANAQLILPTIAATRRHLDQLEEQLIHSLVAEKIAAVMREISTKAFYTLDTVVRNLYERTADVAFLATDRELGTLLEDRLELMSNASRGVDPELLNLAASRAAKRLAAYRRKYTVYDGLALLAPDGVVIASDSAHALPTQCHDEFVQQALAQDGYLEYFGPTSLRPHRSTSLIYCHRIIGPQRGQTVGLLCLSFDLEGEMAGIFATHRDPAARYNLLLLNEAQQCIAAADATWIAPGSTVPSNPDNHAHWQIHAGRLYLIATRSNTNYQGYPGPKGWRGQVMIPLDLAFIATPAAQPDLPPGLLEYAGKLCPPLQDVLQAAATIHRVVWNGQVMSLGINAPMDSGPEQLLANALCNFDAILDQISEAGARSDLLFHTSARNLYETILAADLQDANLVARLMVDLLDRNLYERANDCRWWALTDTLQHALEQPDPASLAEAQRTLSHIHQLYTVYTSIFLYDREGKVIAQSTPGSGDALPSEWQVDASTLNKVLALEDEQAYWVEGFAPSPTYQDRPTYLYHAAICNSNSGGQVVGGIGLVFNSALELGNMIDGSLAGKAQTHACFLDRHGKIIAASQSSGLEAGQDFPMSLAQLESLSQAASGHLVEHEQQYVITACAVSQGYREFKREDGYDDPVMAVVYHVLGPVQKNITDTKALLAAKRSTTSEAQANYAIFSCGSQFYALEGIHIHEALPASALLPIASDSCSYRVGMLSYQNQSGRQMVWVYDLAALLGETRKASAETQAKEIIILKTPRGPVGVLLDALHTVGRYSTHPLMTGSFTEHSLIQEVLHVSDQIMVPVLNLYNLLTNLQTSTLTHPA